MPHKNLHLIDLYNVPKKCLPMIVVSAGDSLISKAIRWWTAGEYSHIMWLWRPGYLASQDLFGYREVPVGKYTGGHRLRLYYFPAWDYTIRTSLQHRIGCRLVLPLSQRRYDVLGIAGHILGRAGIHATDKDYCVESVMEDLHAVGKCLSIDKQNTPQAVADAIEAEHTAMIYGDLDVQTLIGEIT